MRADAFEETLKTLKNKKPFSPFTVVLVSGDRFEVDFPDALSYRGGVGSYIGPKMTPWVFDHQGVSHIIWELMEQPPGE